jgi:hypothetical protein
MTAPTEPTPGAPAGPAQPAPPVPAPPQRAGQPTPADPWAGFTWDGNVDALPADVQKVIRDARAEAAKERTGAKATAAAEARTAALAEVARALGLKEDPPDPADLMRQVEQARDTAWTAGVELAVHRFAGSADVADKLLDSMTFIKSLDDLVDLEPGSTEFSDALKAKVQEAAANLTTATPAGQASATGPRPDPSQGARGAAPARPTSLGEAISRTYAAKR